MIVLNLIPREKKYNDKVDSCYLHIITANNMKTKNDLLDSLRGTVNPFMTIIQNQV